MTELDLDRFREKGKVIIPGMKGDQAIAELHEGSPLILAAFEHICNLYPYVVYAKPQFNELPPGAIMGTYQYSIPGKARFIWKREKEIFPGVLPGDLARTYVKLNYDIPIRRRKNQLNHNHSVPQYAKVGDHGDCHYVDIKAAYLSILRLGFDLEYLPGQYLTARPVVVPDEIKRHKTSYSIAVSMSANGLSHLEVMGYNGPFERHPMNNYSNPCLFTLAQDTLNAIGSEVLKIMGDKVVYVNTDGYIVKDGFEYHVIRIIESWGMKATIKYSGRTRVSGVGRWRVGDFHTQNDYHVVGDFMSNLTDQDDRVWLKDQMVRWQARVPGV